MVFYPATKVIELKSLKQYIYELRNIVVSYERLMAVVYKHSMTMYEPSRLGIAMICNPRGGISSRLTVDSDWKARGGKEEFMDWKLGERDTWAVEM